MKSAVEGRRRSGCAPAGIARLITSISHDAFSSGMHTAFLVAAMVALAGAAIALLTKPGHAST